MQTFSTFLALFVVKSSTWDCLVLRIAPPCGLDGLRALFVCSVGETTYHCPDFNVKGNDLKQIDIGT